LRGDTTRGVVPYGLLTCLLARAPDDISKSVATDRGIIVLTTLATGERQTDKRTDSSI